MSIIIPFRGLHPKPEYAKDIASPPYDVLNTKEARIIVEKTPNSFLRVNKAELEFDDSVNPYSEKVYKRGKDNLQRLSDLGLMTRDEKPCLYLYQIIMNGKGQTGLVALSSVEEYNKGLIKKHEHTRPEKVNDRANHIEFVGAQVGPIFSTFRFDADIDKLFKRIGNTRPYFDFVADDGIQHKLWIISDEEDLNNLQNAFKKLPYMYIADGHHRSQSASEVCKRAREKNPNHTGKEIYNYFLNVMFPDKELNILPYNRVIVDLNNLTLAKIIEMASEKFQIFPQSSIVTPNELHTFGLYCEEKWYLLKAKDGTYDPKDSTGSIDAAILGNNFIDPIFSISDPKTDKRINFVGGIRGTKELVK
ncbi:DUF1015 domain-containing protein, partial [bacterium]|nr:DUF1015 domain-containing protein [bacterium]